MWFRVWLIILCVLGSFRVGFPFVLGGPVRDYYLLSVLSVLAESFFVFVFVCILFLVQDVQGTPSSFCAAGDFQGPTIVPWI